MTDDKENVFAYAATDEKENDHCRSRAHLPGAELALLAFASAATTRTRTEVFSELLLLWLRESFWIGLTNYIY